MRIAQIAPLAESVPPQLYGGTERVVSYLTEELVAMGHNVTLFASADSRTKAKLVGCAPMALRLDARASDHLPYLLLMLEQVRARAEEFDVIHFHVDLLSAPVQRLIPVPSVTTLHGRLDLADLVPFYRGFPDVALVSISDAQRRPMPPVNWVRTIHHGLPLDLLPFQPNPQNYLAFLGRISPEKRPDRAIEIARRTGMRLRIAAKVDKADEAYWAETIEPMVRANPLIEYVGEIGESEKAEFLGNAVALLFPIDWPEPFGLVMVEAMACGTPVIAYPHGSVREVLDGETGVVVGNLAEASAAVATAAGLDRRGVRTGFERRFSVRRMADAYLRVYEDLCGDAAGQATAARGARLESILSLPA